MNYPVWDIPFLGSGLVIALIATFHVLVSHLAIGAGAVIFGAELWASRNKTDAPRIREWLKTFTLWFVITTTVLGAITGVGIWFSIQLAQPEATSLLIHQFVFVWASEWVVFFAELTILYFYYYGWNRNSAATQLRLAGAYAIVSWLSLFAINGILTFMMTPGRWTLENKDLVAGFFNPTFWPSLVTRTLVMLALGGLFGLFIASFIKDKEFKNRAVLFCAKWILPAAVLLPFCLYWYWGAIPAQAKGLVAAGAQGLSGGRMESLNHTMLLGLASAALVLLGVVVVTLYPRIVTRLTALLLLLVAFFGILGGEFFREQARKPYVIYDFLYSNSMWKHQTANPENLKKPLLAAAQWHPEPTTALERGEWVYRLQCASCHTRDGYRSLAYRTRLWTQDFGQNWLGNTMHTTGIMPPFQGDDAEKAALTSYLLFLRNPTTAATVASAKTDSALRTNPMPPADPLGFPLPIPAIQILAYVTLSLHLMAVQFTLGGAILFLWNFFARRPGSEASNRYLGTSLPLGVSYLVTLGIPPLLFVQTLYGQQFYSSSVLMGLFWIHVIALVIAGYMSFHVHRLTRDKHPRLQPYLIGVSLLALLAVGFLLVTNITLSISPAKWLDLYAKHPNGTALNLAEPTLWPRLLMVICPSPAVAGIGLALFGVSRFRKGLTLEATRARAVGVRSFYAGAALSVGALIFLSLSLPADYRAALMAQPMAKWLLGATLVFFVAACALVAVSGKKQGYAWLVGAAVSWLAAFLPLVVLRDGLRMEYLKPYFQLDKVPIHPQWGMFGVFLLTAVVLFGLVGWFARRLVKERSSI